MKSFPTIEHIERIEGEIIPLLKSPTYFINCVCAEFYDSLRPAEKLSFFRHATERIIRNIDLKDSELWDAICVTFYRSFEGGNLRLYRGEIFKENFEMLGGPTPLKNYADYINQEYSWIEEVQNILSQE